VTTLHRPGIGPIEATLLMEWLLDLRGHPRLTHWEEQFCCDMQRRVRELGAGILVSPKQRAVLLELQDKVGAELPDDPDDQPEEEPADNLDLERWPEPEELE
jgi:hypothetical protein